MIELPNGAPYYEVTGEYEYWAVYEYRTGETGRATYDRLTFTRKGEATAACNALNGAVRRAYKLGYNAGQKEGMKTAFKAALGK